MLNSKILCNLLFYSGSGKRQNLRSGILWFWGFEGLQNLERTYFSWEKRLQVAGTGKYLLIEDLLGLSLSVII